LRRTITAKEQKISQLQIFARMKGTTLRGRGLSQGMAEGKALIYTPADSDLPAAHQHISQADVEAEIKRLDIALAAAIKELDITQKHLAGDVKSEENALLKVHMAMINDIGFWNNCRQRVRNEMVKIEHVIAEEVKGMSESLEALKHEIMRERGADIRDIGRRVLRHIRNNGDTEPNRLASLPPNTILVAKELLPSDIFDLDKTNLAAIVTEHNSPSSHVAILARHRNIPAISDIKDATMLLAAGDHLLVDADLGTVTVEPTEIQKEFFAARRKRYIPHKPPAEHDSIKENATKDGVRIGLLANISREDEACLVSEYKLEGVGLFRTGFLFLDVPHPPDLDTQAKIYSAVARMLNPLPVVIRTMDFGGDKIPSFNNPESDMVLRTGKRGLAFSLAEKNMFRTQIRAILRAARAGNVRIMFPMVMGVEDLREAIKFVDEAIETEQSETPISIGAMIETPAAVIQIRDIVKMVDFVSIGTNDLTNFILTTDRHSQKSHLATAFLHPSVLRATRDVVQTAIEEGVDLSVCGDSAANPISACLLVGMGVRNLSMNPFQTPPIRQFLRQTPIKQMETMAKDALEAMTPQEVQQIAETALQPVTR